MSEQDLGIRRNSNSSIGYSLPDSEKSQDNLEQLSHITRTTRITSVPDGFDPNYDPNFDEDNAYDESPYPEVRSAVANFDDVSMPVNTIRAWCLGLIWAILIPGVNQFFAFRYPTISVGGLVPQILSYPIGRLWASFVPRVKIFGISINPGPFTIKEHVLVTIMAGVGATSAYAADIIAVQRIYFHQDWSFVYQWMLFMSTQMIGFSTGGIAKRLLVSPPSMIWPNTLVLCALFNTLHSQQYLGAGADRGISREKFFAYVLAASCVWFFIPGYLFQALSLFNWVCWIAPNNVMVNQLFGNRSGLGLSILSFDWNEIAYIGSPLVTPWWAEANVIAGFVIFYWILTPILYYSDVWYSKRLPLMSWIPYDNTAKPYNLSRILHTNGTFDVTAYKEYSPLFLSTSFAVSYGLSFACITATIVHSILYFWKPIKIHFWRSMKEQPDVHAKLMSNYRQVPEWWYGIILGITFLFAALCVQLWPTHMPVWAVVIALIISAVYLVPIGMILAITNREIGLNVISELIVGYMLPGRPVAMMIFKTLGYISVNQAMIFTSDFKLGHYMKIPPRVMFFAQVIATVIAGTVQLGVQSWMFANIPNICDPDQKQQFTCAHTQVFGTAAIVWGVIGPRLQFSQGIYSLVSFSFSLNSAADLCSGLMMFFLLGAICPIITWFLARRYPSSWIAYINFPIFFGGVYLMPPATSVNYVPWAVVGFFFQYLVRRRHFQFWAKYNYVLSAALDAGTALGTILVYFCLQFPMDGQIGIHTIQAWWGNTVHEKTVDWHARPLISLEGGATFGPTAW